jgi:hypothetical protein
MDMSELRENPPVVLTLHDTKLVVPLDIAVQVASILWSCDLKVLKDDCCKDETTGQYRTTKKIVPANKDAYRKAAIEYLSAADYLVFTSNGESE